MKENAQTSMTIENTCGHENNTNSINSNRASLILSIFYGVLVVNLAIVFTASHYIDSAGPLELSDYYLNVLYAISILWWISFGISIHWGCNQVDANNPIKSHHASNRWLKGVVAVFAFTITIKDGLELIALTEITHPLCTHKILYILMPILHTPYIFGQVIFLFSYSKHYLQRCQYFVRFGIMHVMATNLSVWIATVANEAIEAFNFDNLATFDSTTTLPLNVSQKGSIKPTYSSNRGLFHGYCTCTSKYCTRVIDADKFLYPFLIEFCLITTCLFYVSWQNVGQKTKEQSLIIKPSHKFYKTYKGPTAGALVLAITVTLIIVLGSFDARVANKSFSTEYIYLYIYEGLLISCELSNLLACLLGFYLYKTSNKQKRETAVVNLDIVLLFVCLIGPLLMGLFSILSLCIGHPESKLPHWWISVAYPVVDMIAITVQITFIAYGMLHVSSTTVAVRLTSVSYIEESNSDGENPLHESASYWPLRVFDNLSSNGDLPSQINQSKPCKVAADKHRDRNTISSIRITTSSPAPAFKVYERKRQDNQERAISEVELAAPDRIRIALRDVIMYLVISNASIWLLISLDNTVFSTLSYQYNYFGHSLWTTLTAVTTPLSIFFRMHSAACLFEMWSYA